MNSTAQTRIFGIRVGLDPEIIVALLIAVAAILFWYNSQGDQTAVPSTQGRPAISAVPPSVLRRAPGGNTAAQRRGTKTADHGTLRLQAIDATRGDVDPTLRLDLLARLQSVGPAGNGRNLFQMGATPLTDSAGRPIPHPIIPPKPPQPVPNQPPAAVADVNIPLKYYGFAKPVGTAGNNRGFFLDGDNILIASEGEVLKERYLVVELTGTSARVEDTQVKKGKALPLEPEAKEQFSASAANAGFESQ